jgi:hypothetical protein
MPVADIADHERTSALRRDLEQLSGDAGGRLLRALGVKGDEADLRSASDEFSGHCLALSWAASLAVNERNPTEIDRLASDLIELSTRQNLVHWPALGAIYRGWARSASGDTAEGIPWIEQGIRDFRVNGSVLGLPYFLALKAEALHTVYGDVERQLFLQLLISNQPHRRSSLSTWAAQDASGRNFIPQCDLTRYCNGTRVYSCKGATVCQKPCWLFSQQPAESGIAVFRDCG